MNSQLEIVVRARAILLDAGVNDAPIIRSRDGSGKSVRLPIDLWLTDGGDALTAVVSPIEAAREAPLLELALAFPGDRRPPLNRVTWSFSPDKAFEPFRLELPFASVGPIATTLWRDVPDAIDLDDAAFRAASAVGLSLHGAMAVADLDAVEDLVSYRTEETARALGFEPAENRESVRSAFKHFFQTTQYSLVPVTPEEIRITPCVGDRVFHLTRSDGSELIVTRDTPSSRAQTMQVYVSRIGGVWRVVR